METKSDLCLREGAKAGVEGLSQLSIVLKFLTTELTVPRPPEDVIKKILNLSGLLDVNSVSTWRNERKPEINLTKRSFRVESFQSLPSSPHLTKNIHKVQSADSISRSNQKYISKYRNSEQPVEDKILNTIILSKLNKFSADTYDDIRNFLFQIIGSDDSISANDKNNVQEFIKDFMALVFKKAASEEIFCPLYAKLLGEISSKYPIILDEMNKLHENYLEVFDPPIIVSTEVETEYNKLLEKNREKKYRQGYSQFLAELTAIRILSVDKLTLIFEKIFAQILLQARDEGNTILIEQYIDCLLRIAKVLQKKDDEFYINTRKTLLNIVSTTMLSMKQENYKSMSSKSRFLLMDIQDYLK